MSRTFSIGRSVVVGPMLSVGLSSLTASRYVSTVRVIVALLSRERIETVAVTAANSEVLFSVWCKNPTRSKHAMNVLSLFSGIGGLELGLERAGITTVGQVEIDPYCQRVLAKHWPNVPRHDDVRTAVEWWQSEERPRVDVICGGFPCQDISAAGKRAGIIDGQRSSLWTFMAHAVRVLRPRYVLVENVARIVVRGADGIVPLDVIAGDLAEIGYDLRWDCVPAASIGAPHQRDRWFGIAYPQRDTVRVESVTEPGRGGASFAGLDGPERGVANTESVGRRQGRPGGSAGDGAYWKAVWPQALADTTSARYETGTDRAAQPAATTRGVEPERPGDRARRLAAWAIEPDVGRVADGVPNRVDRLRALGNAVVPQVAEHIGRLIVGAPLGVTRNAD